MNRRNIVKVGLVALVVLLLAAIPLLGACAPKEEAAPPEVEKWVKIGFSHDLSGPLTATQTPELEGVRSYFKMVNDQGGIAYKDPKTGKTMHVKIDVMWADDGYKMDNIISNYTRFKDAGCILFEHGSSGADVALADIARKDKIPLFHGAPPECLYPKYPGSPGHPASWVLGLIPCYADALGAWVDWVMDNWTEDRPPKMGFLTVDSPFGKQPIIDASLAYMEEKGMEYVGAEFYLPTDVDVIPQLTRLDKKGVDWVFHNFVWEGFCTVLKSASDLGLRDRMNFISNINLFAKGIAEMAGEQVAEGSYGMMWYADLDSDLPGVKLMREQILKYYPNTHLENNHFIGWGGYGLPVGCGIKSALEEVGYPITGEDVLKGMFSADGKGCWADTGGLYPPIDYSVNPKDATGMHKVRIVQFQGGEIVDLTGWVDTVPLTVRQYAE